MPTVIAAVAASHGRFPSPVTVLLVIAGVAYVMWSRMQGQPLKAKRLIVLPALYLVLGVGDLKGHETAGDIAFLAVGLGLSVILGAARGSTIELSVRDGALWQRYRGITVGLWLTLIASKVVLAAIAHVAGAAGGAGTNGLLFSLGLSLLAESAVVGLRALSTGVPFAQDEDEDKPGDRRPSRPLPPPAPENWRSPSVGDGLAWIRRQIDNSSQPSR
jgi:hypothetical protein